MSNRGSPYELHRTSHSSRFVCDVTIEDNETVRAGEEFIKIWRLKNNGSLPWPENTMLTFIGGNKELIGESDAVVVPPVAPGDSVDVAVDMKAPPSSVDPVCTAFWQLCSPDGTHFGQRVWCKVQLGNDAMIDTDQTVEAVVV